MTETESSKAKSADQVLSGCRSWDDGKVALVDAGANARGMVFELLVQNYLKLSEEIVNLGKAQSAGRSHVEPKLRQERPKGSRVNCRSETGLIGAFPVQ